jgi:hypothetical protein
MPLCNANPTSVDPVEPRGQRGGIVESLAAAVALHAVVMRVEHGKDRRAGGAAKWVVDERIREAHPMATGLAAEIGHPTAQRANHLVVGENDQHIRPRADLGSCVRMWLTWKK